MAIGVDDDTRARLTSTLPPLAGRAVPPDEWHLTLRFIGSVVPAVADRVVFALDEGVVGTAFDIGWGGLGAFPRASRATVLWVDVSSGRDRLFELVDQVERAVVSVGFRPEDRPFRPHLTLSRIRPPEDVTELVASTPTLGGRMRCEAVVLMESRLDRSRGDRYRVIESFPLG